MILVDSSVWIDWLRDRDTPQTRALERLRGVEEIVLGDLVLLELLCGAPHEAAAGRLLALLAPLRRVELVGHQEAAEAARAYRRLRALGHTPRKPIDLLIGTFCILNGCRLLHADRGFEPMTRHLGLAVVEPAEGAEAGGAGDPAGS